MEQKILHLFRQEDPDVRARVPGPAAIVAQHGFDAKSGAFDPARHLRDGQRTEGQIEAMFASAAAPAFDVPLFERREPPPGILPDRFHQCQVRPSSCPPHELDLVRIFAPVRDVGNQIDAKCTATPNDARDRLERGAEIALADESLGFTNTFYFEGGIVSFVRALNRDLAVVNPTPFYVDRAVDGRQGRAEGPRLGRADPAGRQRPAGGPPHPAVARPLQELVPGAGASGDEAKNTARPQRYLSKFGFAGKVFPVNANSAEARRIARFWTHGHTPGPMLVRAEAPNPALPTTLDLRWKPLRRRR